MNLRLGCFVNAGAASTALQLVRGRGFGAFADLDVRTIALQVALGQALGDGRGRAWLRQFDLAGCAAVRHGALSELSLEVGGRALLAAQIDSGRAVVRLVQDLAGGGHTAVEAANVARFLVLGAVMRMARRGYSVGVAVVAGVMVEGRAL